MSQVSARTSFILTLLNNINELIVESSDRQNAKDVMRALEVYARNKKFQLPEEKIENFYARLIDGRPITLTSIIRDIAQDVFLVEKKK